MKACPGCVQQVLPRIAPLATAPLPAVTWRGERVQGNYRQSPSGRQYARSTVG